MFRKALPLVIAALTVSCAVPRDELNTAEITRNLESMIPGLMEKARIPGLQIALIRDGDVVWEKGFGVTNSMADNPVTTDTIFEAASLTKPLFAHAVMQMVDEGLVDLDRPIVTLLTSGKVEDFLGHPLDADDFRADWFETITPRHVLSHSSGMPHGESGMPYPLLFEPGTDWKYSAAGYVLLQYAVEEITGRTLDEIISQKVLGPFGMKKSSMVWRDAYEETMANGHELYGEPVSFRKRTEANSAASLYTTAGDFALFASAVISGERLQPDTAREMLTSFIDMTDEGRLGWSLGFGLQQDDHGTAFWQWGDYGIFRNYVIADPKERTGIVYLTNSFNGLAVCSDVVAAGTGREALGNTELEYQPYDGPFYTLLWDAREKGPAAVAEQLPEIIAGHPDIFTSERISGMGEILEGREMYDEAAVFLGYNLEQYPDSGLMMSNLAHTKLMAGDYARARAPYIESLEAEEDPSDPNEIAWIMDYLRAMEEPALVDQTFLQKIAGNYGPRHLHVREGQLYYSRDTTDITAQRPLHAISDDTFALEGVTYFRLRVVLDDDGEPIKLVGMYEGGRTDESMRD